jgi:hypothetical protein
MSAKPAIAAAHELGDRPDLASRKSGIDLAEDALNVRRKG